MTLSHGCGYSMNMGNHFQSLSLEDVSKKVADVIVITEED